MSPPESGYRNPVPTVDAIIEVGPERKIVLIERKNPPHGWALPGGFVDYSDIFAPLVDPRLVQWIADSSSYFQLKAVVQIDTVRVSLFTMMVRNPQTGDVTPILRSLGTI